MNIVVYYKKEKKIPSFLSEAIKEYDKRLSRYCKLKQVAVSDFSKVKDLDKEGVFTFWVHPTYPSFSSEKLSEQMASLSVDGFSTLQFVLTDLPSSVDNPAVNENARFSLLTVQVDPSLERTVLLEQIYRGFRINRGEPYHK